MLRTLSSFITRGNWSWKKWVDFSQGNTSSRVGKVCVCVYILLLLLLSLFSRVRLCATPQTAAHQAPPSLGFSRQEHWSGLPFPSPVNKSESDNEVTQLCLTPRDPMDYSLSGSSVHGICQARVLEWVAIAFSNTLSRFVITFLPRSKHLLISWLQSPSAVTLLLLSRFSRVRLYVTQWTTAHQATPSLGFSRQEHWSRLPFPSPMHESEEWKWSRSVVSDS